MKMMRREYVSVSVCLLFLLLPVIAFSHPESEHMPDSIAETEYGIAIDLNPGDIEARNELGHLFYRHDRLDEAIEQFEAVLKIDNDNSAAQKGMGLILMKQEKYEDAEKSFRKALESGEDPLVIKELHKLEQLLEKKR